MSDKLVEAAKSGRLKEVSTLLEDPKVLPHLDGIGGKNVKCCALAGAARYNRKEILKLLISAGANVNVPDPELGQTALHMAAANKWSESVQILIDAKAHVDVVDARGNTALFCAVTAHDEKSVKILLDVDTNHKDIQCEEGRTAIVQASQRGYHKIVQMLAESKACLDVPEKNGYTALMYACKTKGPMVNVLLKHGAEVNVADETGTTALMVAASTKNKDHVEALLQASADLNRTQKRGWAALHFAIDVKCADIVVQLAKSGADINSRASNQETPLIQATSKNAPAVVKVLLDEGADVSLTNKDGNTALLCAVHDVREEIVELLLQAKAGVAVTARKDGQTALHVAAAFARRLPVLKQLVESGADVNLRNETTGETPLMSATDDTIEYLVQANASVNLQDKSGASALMYAVRRRKMDAILALCKHGADILLPSHNGSTPLHCSVAYDKPELVQCVLAQGSNINQQDSEGKTALFVAVMGSKFQSLRTLLAAKPPPNLEIANVHGTTPLYQSLHLRKADMTEVLLNAGASPNAIWGPFKRSALIQAVVYKALPIVELLVSHGADLDFTDSQGDTALIHSVKSNCAEIVRFLVKTGVTVTAQNLNGLTALDLARSSNENEIIGILGNAEECLIEAVRGGNTDEVERLLREFTIDFRYKDRHGASAVHLAVLNGEARITKHLVQAGADVDMPDATGCSAVDINPWLVADAIADLMDSKLGQAQSAEQFLHVLRSFPAVCVFVISSVDLSDEQLSTIKSRITSDLIETVRGTTEVRNKSGDAADAENGRRDTDLRDLRVIDALLTEFCDAPLERLRKAGHADRLTVPQWLNSTIVAGAYEAFCTIMDAKKASIAVAPGVIESYRTAAQEALADDRTIYEAVLDKMIHKNPIEATEIRRQSAAAREVIKSRYSRRRTQPSLNPQTSTLLHLMVQAAKEHGQFSEFVEGILVPQIAVSDFKVTLAPTLKKSSRIQQKWWLRQEVVSICDVVRALATVPTFSEMLLVHNFLMSSTHIEVLDFKDRLNHPTSGGWTDCVYLFRVKSEKSTGHICELQLALEPLVTARSSLHGHVAYTRARHKIEMLSALGISVNTDSPPISPQVVPTSTGDDVVVEETLSLKDQNIALKLRNDALETENEELKNENQRLKARLDALVSELTNVPQPNSQ